MRHPESLWILSDTWSMRRLRWRGALLLLGGRLLGDEFMKLAGRFALHESHRRPVVRIPPRRAR